MLFAFWDLRITAQAMPIETDCAECRQLHKAYSEATVKYLRHHNGQGNTEEYRTEGRRLYDGMSDAKRALIAHQQEHALRN